MYRKYEPNRDMELTDKEYMNLFVDSDDEEDIQIEINFDDIGKTFEA